MNSNQSLRIQKASWMYFYYNLSFLFQALSLRGYHFIAPINVDNAGKNQDAVKSTLFSMLLLSNHFNFKRSTYNKDLSNSKITIEFTSVDDKPKDLETIEPLPVVIEEGDMLIIDPESNVLVPEIPRTIYKTMFLDTQVLHNENKFALCQVTNVDVVNETMINFKSDVVCFILYVFDG